MTREELSRRAFMRKVGAVAATLAGGYVVSACGGGERAPGAQTSAAPDCSDLTGLTEQEKSMRATLQYVEVSEVEGRNCLNCNFYSQEEGAACGACTLIKGPIAPNGWCASWVAKPS